jgi:low affinity Fe/Cu permease
MKNHKLKQKEATHFFERMSSKATALTGSTPAIIIAFLTVIIWAACGPIFHYSTTWQLVINTGTTIVTFLMVFLIQKSQNKDALAIQLKLDELVAAHESASNRLVDVENMTEEELKVIQKYYKKLREGSLNEDTLIVSRSIDELDKNMDRKLKNNKEK